MLQLTWGLLVARALWCVCVVGIQRSTRVLITWCSDKAVNVTNHVSQPPPPPVTKSLLKKLNLLVVNAFGLVSNSFHKFM